MNDKAYVFDIMEESFISESNLMHELDVFYELKRKNLFIREGSQ